MVCFRCTGELHTHVRARCVLTQLQIVPYHDYTQTRSDTPVQFLSQAHLLILHAQVHMDDVIGLIVIIFLY